MTHQNALAPGKQKGKKSTLPTSNYAKVCFSSLKETPLTLYHVDLLTWSITKLWFRFMNSL